MALTFFAPSLAHAHEVYVLSESEVVRGLATPPVNPLDIIAMYANEFVLWAFIGVLIVFSIFFISISRRLENNLDPFLIQIKHYAPFIARITFGLAFLSAAYYGALFGPELPLTEVFNASVAPIIRAILGIIGALAILGLYARTVAFIAIAIYAFAVYKYGTYMLTYANYLGEMLVLLIVGSHRNSIEWITEHMRPHTKLKKARAVVYDNLSHYSFLVLRITFGISLIYASWYAKFLHNDLAVQTVVKHHLDTALGFEPLFLVLGAAIVEMMLGVFFILGIEIRFASLFLGVFLVLSLIYFGEVVWPHIILFGVAAALFTYGYDKYSLEGRFFKKGDREPIF